MSNKIYSITKATGDTATDSSMSFFRNCKNGFWFEVRSPEGYAPGIELKPFEVKAMIILLTQLVDEKDESF